MMRILKNREFRFSADKTITALLAASLCFSMSYWQWTRYQEKIVYFESLDRQAQRPTQPLDPGTTRWEDALYGKFLAQGHLDFDHEVVLINRSKDNVMGVRVVTPLRLEHSQAAILVDRGFLPYGDYDQGNVDRYQRSLETQIEGIARPSQSKTFFLAPDIRMPADGSWKARWLRLDVPKMASQLPYPILPVYLEQTNQAGEFPQYDSKVITKPARHLNYTFQWIGFGLFAIFLAAFLQFRPKPPAQVADAGPKPPEHRD